MSPARPFLLAVALLAPLGLVAAQDKAAPATVKLLVPKGGFTSTSVKIEGKDLGTNDQAATTGVRVVQTPPLEPGKTYAYKIEALIEPNNYTKITRTREVTFKAGETVTVDLTQKDAKNPDQVVIRWVPTPKEVVKDMCELAKVTKDDVVMDPGCGDGIMVITAVQDFKAKRGKGNDFDAKKVEETRAAVEKAGLKDRIAVKQGDALKLGAEDLGDVTVLMLYMGNDFNNGLRPLIWEHMKPGTRVVSHRFIMGDWKPDRSITVNRDSPYGRDDFHLHVWTVTGKEKAGDYPKVDPSTLNQ